MQTIGATKETIVENNNSSILRHGLRLIYIKSCKGDNFVKIYQNLPKFGNLGKNG